MKKYKPVYVIVPRMAIHQNTFSSSTRLFTSKWYLKRVISQLRKGIIVWSINFIFLSLLFLLYLRFVGILVKHTFRCVVLLLRHLDIHWLYIPAKSMQKSDAVFTLRASIGTYKEVEISNYVLFCLQDV